MLGWPGIRCLVNLSASSHDVVKTSSKHTEVHDVITANSTVINDNIPCPESYGIPLLDLKLLLALDALAVRALSLLGDRRIAHLNVGHGGYSVRNKN
jgi:hypothetical protein